MKQKLKKYLDGVFSPYEEIKAVKELKEELFNDLQEKMKDLKNEGYDEETAFNMAIDSIGEVSEIIESINAKTRQLQQMVGMDLSKSNLEKSDFNSVKIHDGKFNYSNLQESDFTNADLSNSSFKCSDLQKVKFDHANLTGAKIEKSSLKGASFNGSNLESTNFKYSDLSGVSFDGQTLNGTIFDYSGLKGASFRNAVLRNVSFKTNVKKTIFDGATMDKLTYAILKGYKASLDNVTVI